ncbi:hypothetical protein VTK26DRAFT_2864 [Humicola hyalothermophila]
MTSQFATAISSTTLKDYGHFGGETLDNTWFKLPSSRIRPWRYSPVLHLQHNYQAIYQQEWSVRFFALPGKIVENHHTIERGMKPDCVPCPLVGLRRQFSVAGLQPSGGLFMSTYLHSEYLCTTTNQPKSCLEIGSPVNIRQGLSLGKWGQDVKVKIGPTEHHRMRGISRRRSGVRIIATA